MKNSFMNLVLKEVPRLIKLIDKRKDSKTYGCCYKPYWNNENDPLIPESNFINSRWQEMALTLALLFSKKYPKNKYYKSYEILDLIKIVISFWVKTQHKDGSFSEWGIYEHGQPPTAFGLFAMIETYNLIKNMMSKTEKEKLENSFEKAANWLCKNIDENALNHEAVAISALYSAYILFKKKYYIDKIKEKISLIKKYQSNEGWIKEIDGPDSGYNGVTLTYLSIYFDRSNDKNIIPIFKKILQFNKYFVYPDFINGGGVNSRFASASWPLGYAILSKKYSLAKSLCYLSLQSITKNKISGQHNYTDYQRCVSLYYYLMTFDKIKKINMNKVNLKNIPSLSDEIFSKKFNKGKITIIKNKIFYLVIGPGNCIGSLYSYKSKRTVLYTSPMKLINTSGFIVETFDGKIFSSMTRNNNISTSYSKNKILCDGVMYPSTMERWQLKKGNKKIFYMKYILHIISNNFPTLYKNIFKIHRKFFKKKCKDFITFTRNFEIINNELKLNNYVDLRNFSSDVRNAHVKETFFIPFEDEKELYIILDGEKHKINEVYGKKYLTKNIIFYFSGEKIMELNIGEKSNILFIMKDDRNDMSKNNMKFTGGRGLVLCKDINNRVENNYSILL